MTPPASTAAANGHPRSLRRGTGPRAPRRVSGPAAKPKRGAAAGSLRVDRGRAPTAGGAVALPRPRAGAPIGAGLARRLVTLAEHPWLDRLLTGRVWIGLIAVGLIGLVFMQVSLLKLNSGIGRAVERSAELDRTNSLLRADVSKLEANDRIQAIAQDQLHMVLPDAGQVTFIGRDGHRMGGEASAAVPALAQAGTATLPTLPAAAGTPDGAGATTPPATTAPAPAAATGTGPATGAATAATDTAAAGVPSPATSTPSPATSTPSPAAAAPGTTATAPPTTGTAASPTPTGGAVPPPSGN